jgi:GINS complex protein helical bundle domain
MYHITRRLLGDLREVRLAKVRKGVETVGDTYVQMDNLSRMEINETILGSRHGSINNFGIV